MRAFQFSLDSLLRHKQWVELEAKRLLGIEIKKYHDVQEELSRHQEELKALNQSPSTQAGWTALGQWNLILYAGKIRENINGVKERLGKQEEIIHKRQRDLKDAMQERQRMEKLKEREYLRYRAGVRKKDLAVMDEISSNFVRRAAA